MKQPTTDELAERAPPEGAPFEELQLWMMELLRHRKGLDTSSKMRDAAALHFGGNDRLSPAEQINIYRQQFWLRHTSILIDDFPGLTWLLGQKRWEVVVESYLTECGYNVHSLADLGEKMPKHLERVLANESPEIYVDMALLECAYEKAFTAGDDGALSPEKLASIPAVAWASARFQLSHSLQLLPLRFPVANLRRKIQREPESVSRYDLPLAQSENLVVYRRERTLFDKAISRPAFLLLSQLQQGRPLVAACEHVVAEEPSAAAVFDEELASWFGLWGRLGWIRDVIVKD